MRISSQSGTAVTVNNAGTLIKSTSSGTLELGVVNNTGAVQVKRGKLIIDGGTVGGTLSVDAGAVLVFGTLTVTGAVSGAGEVDVTAAAATTVKGGYAVKKTVAGTNATLAFGSGADLTGMGDLVSNTGSTTTFATGNAVTIGNLTMSGEVDAFDPLNVTGTLTLSAGGQLIVWNSLALGSDGAPGQLVWTGGRLDISHGGITGGDTLTIPASGVLVIDESGFSGTIVINGELDVMHNGELLASYRAGETSVPEVGTLGMLAVGGAVLLRRRKSPVR
jgi:MYXO-CTERM domain-containing protein